METRSTKHAPELRGEGENPSIGGYAAVFYRAGDPSTEYELWKGARERIMPGAFDGVTGDDVRALFNHDPNNVLGRSKSGTLKLSVDEVGLRYEIEPSDTTTYRNITTWLRRGDVDGSSFAFSVLTDEWRMEGGNEIREIRKLGKLYDVGPVTFPAYEGASSGTRAETTYAEARSNRDTWAQQQRLEALAREKKLREISIPLT